MADPEPTPAPVARPAAPGLDRAAVAKAEDERDSARRSRRRAEARLEGAEARLASTEIDAASAVTAMKSYLARVQDPSGRLTQARSRGALLKSETERLEKELALTNGSPRPGRKRLIDKSPVARPPGGSEFHFELRKNRVSFIDLDRLMDSVNFVPTPACK